MHETTYLLLVFFKYYCFILFFDAKFAALLQDGDFYEKRPMVFWRVWVLFTHLNLWCTVILQCAPPIRRIELTQCRARSTNVSWVRRKGDSHYRFTMTHSAKPFDCSNILIRIFFVIEVTTTTTKIFLVVCRHSSRKMWLVNHWFTMSSRNYYIFQGLVALAITFLLLQFIGFKVILIVSASLYCSFANRRLILSVIIDVVLPFFLSQMRTCLNHYTYLAEFYVALLISQWGRERERERERVCVCVCVCMQCVFVCVENQ